MLPLCHLQGRVQPLADARIDPLDRGLIYGDGVYEVVRVVDGIALLLDRHLARLERSLEAVEIPSPPGLDGACAELLRACGIGSGSLYLQVTRGVAPRVHLPPLALVPTVLLVPSEHSHAAPGAKPLRAVSMSDPRWGRCDIKTTSLMGTVLGKLRARDANADEVLFVGPDGGLREGGSTALFVRAQGCLWTHPLDGHVLPSLTRERVLGFAHASGIPVRSEPVTLESRESWEEAFLCGTLTSIQGVVELDGVPVADGTVGAWTRTLAACFANDEEQVLHSDRRAERAPR